MSISENAVAQHYGVGDLGQRILDGLKATGKDFDNLTIEDLSVFDEFHIGGRKATEYAISKLSLTGSEHVLDIGCGIGGAVRTIAAKTGCRVTGTDLTPEYIEVAQTLSHLTGFEDQTDFHVASALAMPFEGETFDAAITMHVAMNIDDRRALYQEIARVIKPGARFSVYYVMKTSEESITFPVPWAETAETSHLTSPNEMLSILDECGFKVLDVEDRTDFTFAYFRQRLAAASHKPSPLGPHLVMGASAHRKFENTQRNMECGRIAPVLMIAIRK